MLWLAPIPVILIIFFQNLIAEIRPHGLLDWTMSGLGAFVFTVFPAAFLVGAAFFIGQFFRTQPVETSRYKLVAIRDKDGVVGQFFLGSGTIRGDQYYFYYKTNDDGSVTPDKVYAGQGVRVYEQDRDDAELVVYDWVQVSSWAWLVSFPANHDGWSYKFYVPKGTVRTGFTM